MRAAFATCVIVLFFSLTVRGHEGHDHTGRDTAPDCECLIVPAKLNCADLTSLRNQFNYAKQYQCEVGNTCGENPHCQYSSFMFQAYQYGCAPGVLPMDIYLYMTNLTQCQECFQPRYVSANGALCPKNTCTPEGEAVFTQVTAYLQANCSSSCASADCQLNYNTALGLVDYCGFDDLLPQDWLTFIRRQPTCASATTPDKACIVQDATIRQGVYQMNCNSTKNINWKADNPSYNTDHSHHGANNAAVSLSAMGTLLMTASLAAIAFLV